MRDHADSNRKVGKWNTPLEDEEQEVEETEEQDCETDSGNAWAGEPKQKRGFDMNISNAGRPVWHGGDIDDRNQ